MKLNYLVLTYILIAIFSCTKELNNNAFSKESVEKPTNLNPNSMSKSDLTKSGELKTNWKLTSVYSSFTNEETAYIKTVNNNDYVYPFLWDKHPNIDREPTENELAIKIPVLNYKAIWLDEATFYGNNIDIFLKIISPESYQMCYVYRSNSKGVLEELFSIKSFGDISLKKLDNDNFVIVNSEATDNYIIETTYAYNKNKRQIVLKGTQNVPLNQKYVSKELKALQKQSIEDLEQFIRGAWISTDTEGTPKEKIIYFNSNEREIMFGQGDSIEVFDWKNSSKTFNGIYLTLQNRQIDHIFSNFNLNFEDSNKVSLTFTGSYVWEGKYRRMTAAEKDKTILKNNPILISDIKINGVYKSSNDEEFRFTDNKFEIINASIKKQGMYVLYKLNADDIIEMKFYNDRNLVIDRKVYKLNSIINKEANRTIHLLSLSEGELFIAGFQPFENSQNYLEKIETRQ